MPNQKEKNALLAFEEAWIGCPNLHSRKKMDLYFFNEGIIYATNYFNAVPATLPRKELEPGKRNGE